MITAFVIFYLHWLRWFLLETPAMKVRGMAFLTSLVLILVQDVMMIVILALICSPHAFNDAFIFPLIACTCLPLSPDGQRGCVDSVLAFALNSSFIILNNFLKIVIRGKSQNKEHQPWL